MKQTFTIAVTWIALAASSSGELRVPAFTAYLEPDANAARVSQNSGITGWKNPNLKVLWFGEITAPGILDVSVALRLPTNAVSKLRLTAAGHSRETEVKGFGTNLAFARFGSFTIKDTGY